MRPVESAAVPESCTCPECFFFLFCFLSKKKKAAAFLCLILCCRSGILSEAIKYDERKKKCPSFSSSSLFFLWMVKMEISTKWPSPSRAFRISKVVVRWSSKPSLSCSINQLRHVAGIDDGLRQALMIMKTKSSISHYGPISWCEIFPYFCGRRWQ